MHAVDIVILMSGLAALLTGIVCGMTFSTVAMRRARNVMIANAAVGAIMALVAAVVASLGAERTDSVRLVVFWIIVMTLVVSVFGITAAIGGLFRSRVRGTAAMLGAASLVPGLALGVVLVASIMMRS